VPGSWTHAYRALDPGTDSPQTDLLALKPGDDRLSLRLDTQGQVGEANEANNTFGLTVRVTGSCGPRPGRTSGEIAAPGHSGPPGR
jgi:hypothetical protein